MRTLIPSPNQVPPRRNCTIGQVDSTGDIMRKDLELPQRSGVQPRVSVGRWPSECAALSKSCVGAHSRAESRADRRSSNLVTLPAGVATARDVIECDQSPISAPVMVFREEPEPVGTTAFLSGAEGIRTPDPLTASRDRGVPQGKQIGQKPLADKGYRLSSSFAILPHFSLSRGPNADQE